MTVPVLITCGEPGNEGYRGYELPIYPRVGDEIQLTERGPCFKIVRVVWQVRDEEARIPVIITWPRLPL